LKKKNKRKKSPPKKRKVKATKPKIMRAKYNEGHADNTSTVFARKLSDAPEEVRLAIKRKMITK